MRLAEVIKKPKRFLVHGSKKKFPVGFVLLPQSDGYVASIEAEEHEAIFEQYRPPECLSRSQSVYMLGSTNIQYIDHAGGYNDYVYEVKHQGKVERNDMGWYSEISMLMHFDVNDPELITIVENYWKGVRFPRRVNALWEYRSPSAIVVRLVETNV